MMASLARPGGWWRSATHATATWALFAVGAGGILPGQQPARPREVVVLSSSIQEDVANGILDPVRQYLALPLQYLGLKVRPQKIGNSRPPAVDPRQVRGVVTLLRRGEVLPDWVWPWLQDQARLAGAEELRFVHLGSLEPLARTADEAQRGRLAEWLKRFGLGFDDRLVDDPLRIGIETRDAFAFEQSPDARRLHCGPRSERVNHKIWLTTRLLDSEASPDVRHPVVSGRFGGVALHPFLYRPGRSGVSFRWILNPFEFFQHAFGWEGVPAPAPAVAFGRRMRLLQFDGSGFGQPSSVVAESTCGAVLEERLIRYLRQPVTVGWVAKDLRDTDLSVARRWATHAFVEVASCGVQGPSNWRVPDGAPRSGVEFEAEMAAEVGDGYATLRRLLGKKVTALHLWSGYANPLPSAADAAEELGLLHANGGGFRLSKRADSVGYVTPWGWPVGEALQVYLGAGGGELFPGTYGAVPRRFAQVDQTFTATGSPRILKPVHLRVDFRIAAEPTPLRVLRERVQRWSGAAELVPLPVSAYVRAVRTALRTFAVHPHPGGWRFTGLGGGCTVRCPDESRAVDWAASPGVVGARRLNGALHLLLTGDEAAVRWTAGPRPQPHLVEANHALRAIRRLEKGIELQSLAYGPRRLVLAGFLPSAKLVLSVGNRRQARDADADGRLVLKFQQSGTLNLRVEVRAQ